MTPLPVCRQCGKKSDNPICMRCERGDGAKASIPSAWTPGPWHADFGEIFRIREGDGSSVAYTQFVHLRGRRDTEEVTANARLIAAAPELFEALRQCRLELDYCQQQLAAHGQTGHPEDSVSRALKAGADALAKARGQ